MVELRTSKGADKKKSLHERAFEKVDSNKELKRLEAMLKQLKIDYEQYFLGITLYEPIKLHRAVKKQIRKIRKAPFKKSRHKYRLRTLEYRYHTFNDYWQRVMRQKEDGTYSKDVFKANMRERFAMEDQAALTRKGGASRAMQGLFQSYKLALEKQTGKKQNIDFAAFQRSLIKRARAESAKNGNKKLSFRVVVRDGKVIVKARAKPQAAAK